MFMIVDKDKCPSCAIKGAKWNKNKDIFVCPKCDKVFNEFGILMDSSSKDEMILQ